MRKFGFVTTFINRYLMVKAIFLLRPLSFFSNSISRYANP